MAEHEGDGQRSALEMEHREERQAADSGEDEDAQRDLRELGDAGVVGIVREDDDANAGQDAVGGGEAGGRERGALEADDDHGDAAEGGEREENGGELHRRARGVAK